MGLPIEYKVVKESRELSPLEVRKRCEAFARKFIDIQREQFKRLGVFGDWEHPYLTMDPKYEAEILRAFAVFVEEGLVCRRRSLSSGAPARRPPSPKPKWNIKSATTPPFTSDFRSSSGRVPNALTKRALPSGRRLPGRCRPISPSLWMQRENYVVQEFSRDGTSETLVLAEKLASTVFCSHRIAASRKTARLISRSQS